MEPRGLMEVAMRVASELMLEANQQGLSPKDLLMAMIMAERLVSRTYPGTFESLRETVFEANATFDALTLPPEANGWN